MSKNDFKLVRKESINIDEWVTAHPKYNAAIELDPQKLGYGWIVFRTAQRFEKLTRIESIIEERCWHRENVIIVKAKVQIVTPNELKNKKSSR